MIARIAGACFALSAFACLSHAQTEIYKPYKNDGLWSADTLYVGASFMRLGGGPIRVSLKGNEAGFTGRLYAVNPAPVGGGRADTVPLLTNHDPAGTTVSLHTLTNIPVPGEVVFMYVVERNNGYGPFDPRVDLLRTTSASAPGGPSSRPRRSRARRPATTSPSPRRA